MKKLSVFLILVVTLAAGFLSCNNELDVNDNWREVPVIYGLLDPQDSVHIIKITKAFLGDGNALYMAQIPDSSYYGDELLVEMLEIGPDGGWLMSWIFDTMWIPNKQSGTFFGGDQKLYKVRADLNTNYQYRVSVSNTLTNFFASATTSLVKPVNITKPRGGQKYFSFISSAETQAEITSSAGGRVYQMIIRFHYKEVDFQTLDTLHQYIDWVFPNKKASNLTGGDKIAYSFLGNGFYGNISAKLKVDPNVKRIPGAVDFIGYAGGDELSTLIDITSPINTIVQERPEYTNVTNGGIGILSSRTSAVRSCELTPQSVDSLVNGARTFQLGFVFP